MSLLNSLLQPVLPTNPSYIGLTVTGAGQTALAGTVSADNAATGNIGEVISSSVVIGSAISLTSTISETITSISLTAGDWEVWGNIGFIPATGTISTSYKGSIGQTNNTLNTSPNGGAYFEQNITFPASVTQTFSAGKTRINISSTTTIYLVAQSTFSVSTLTAYGSITARRMR